MTARYRVRNDFKHFHLKDLYLTDGPSGPRSSYNAGPIDQYGELETVPHDFAVFSDVVGQMGEFNPAYHYEFHGDFSDPMPSYDWQNGLWEWDIPNLVCHRPEFNSSVPRKLEPGRPSVATLSAWSLDAFNAFHDQIPEEVKLANFLYELKDIKGLIPKIIRRSPSKTLSSNFLGLEFGWKPMIRDIKKIIDVAASVEKRLQYLKSTVGKEVSLRFTRSMDLSTDPFTLVLSRDGSPRNFKYKRIGQEGTFRVTGKLRQNLSGLDDYFAHWKALAAATGFNNPAAIVWEAIPYSFVVDWFVHLDKLVGSMAIQPFGGEWTLSRVGWSVKQTATWHVYQSFVWGGSSNVDTFLGTISLKSYTREPGLPLVSVFATDASLTPKQLVLSLALLNERR